MNLKGHMKSKKTIMKIYDKLLPFYCICFTKPAVKMLYRQTFQKELDLENPKDLNEKINWLKVYKYKYDPLVARCADKYRVRAYIEEKGCGEILNELYGVYYKADDIDFSVLPNQFVLKLNRGAGKNIICADKKKIDIDKTRETVRSWYHAECGERYAELHYRKSKPCVICEKYLGDDNGNYPIDYKVYTFSGKAHMVEICIGRREKVHFVYVDKDYKRINYGKEKIDDKFLPPKPICFDKMIQYAEILSKPFCHVRMDFYVINNEIVFGEMTFTNSGGFDNYINQVGLNNMGNLLVLPEK